MGNFSEFIKVHPPHALEIMIAHKSKLYPCPRCQRVLFVSKLIIIVAPDIQIMGILLPCNYEYCCNLAFLKGVKIPFAR